MFKSTPLLVELENRSFDVIERAFENFGKLALLFSGGKDSTVLFHLVEQVANRLDRDFYLIHIDTGMNFPEILDFRDQLVKLSHRPLVVESIAIDSSSLTPNRLQSFALNQVILREKFDVIFGGARRDEDKARQKELYFSKRINGQGWQPDYVQPELWPYLFFGKNGNEHYRVFPLNDWTEGDVWAYISVRDLKICDLYYAHPGPQGLQRYRTIGDKSNSLPIKTKAQTPWEVFVENQNLQTPERATRQDDQFSEFAMEIRKKEGYF